MNSKFFKKKEVERHKKLADEILSYRNFLRKYFSDFFTEETENFLCFSTRFEEDERITIEQAFNHMFFANFDQTSYLRNSADSLNKLLKIFLKNENLEISKMYFNSILKNLCSYFGNGERWFKLESDLVEGDSQSRYSLVFEKNGMLINFLSYEFGVSADFLWTRLEQIQIAHYKYIEGTEKNEIFN